MYICLGSGSARFWLPGTGVALHPDRGNIWPGCNTKTTKAKTIEYIKLKFQSAKECKTCLNIVHNVCASKF